MNHPKKNIDATSVTWATETALERINITTTLALNYANDPEKKERLEHSHCRVCWYAQSRWGGAAMTHQPCGICEENQLYSSTATDALCSKCAKDNNLCKQCGADVNLKVRRKYERKN